MHTAFKKWHSIVANVELLVKDELVEFTKRVLSPKMGEPYMAPVNEISDQALLKSAALLTPHREL